jgi:hypothetical protein
MGQRPIEHSMEQHRHPPDMVGQASRWRCRSTVTRLRWRHSSSSTQEVKVLCSSSRSCQAGRNRGGTGFPGDCVSPPPPLAPPFGPPRRSFVQPPSWLPWCCDGEKWRGRLPAPPSPPSSRQPWNVDLPNPGVTSRTTEAMPSSLRWPPRPHGHRASQRRTRILLVILLVCVQRGLLWWQRRWWWCAASTARQHGVRCDEAARHFGTTSGDCEPATVGRRGFYSRRWAGNDGETGDSGSEHVAHINTDACSEATAPCCHRCNCSLLPPVQRHYPVHRTGVATLTTKSLAADQ